MKRPAAIYVLVLFFLSIFVYSMTFLVSKFVIPNSGLQIPLFVWTFGMSESITFLWIFLSCLVLAAVIHGLWQGRPLGRNLALVIVLDIMVYLAIRLVDVLNVLIADDLTGWTLFSYYLMLGFLAIFGFMFYLALRPDVGRFCKVYPEK